MVRIAAVLLVLGALVVALLLAEGVLRVIGFDYPNFYTFETTTGQKLRPGAEGWFREEGQAYVKISSAGLRDREHPIEKSPGALRIAVLGDSYAEALQVDLEQTFWSQLQRDLNACRAFSGKTVEVINFGVSGYGTAQELLTLRHRVWAYSPDVVLLAFLPGNDFRNNSKALEPERLRPFFVLKDGELVPDDSYTHETAFRLRSNGVLQFLRTHSRVMMLVMQARKRFAAPSQPQQQTNVGEGKEKLASVLGAEPGLDERVYAEPKSREWQEAWAITERLILLMNDEVRAHGAKFVMAILTSAVNVHPDAQVRRQYAEHLGVVDLFYADRRLREMAAGHGIDVIALAPAMQRYAESRGQYLHGFSNTMMGFGHWNEQGHRVAGDLIAEHMCAAELSARRAGGASR